MPRKLLPRSFN